MFPIDELSYVLRAINSMPKAYMVQDSLASSFLKLWSKDKVASRPKRPNIFLLLVGFTKPQRKI